MFLLFLSWLNSILIVKLRNQFGEAIGDSFEDNAKKTKIAENSSFEVVSQIFKETAKAILENVTKQS